MRYEPLNRVNGPHILRLYDVCFKHGVIDACKMEDDYEVRRFVEEHTSTWEFGVLGEDLEVDWQMFRFVLYRWCRESPGLTKFAENYLLRVRITNLYWCLLPYCMRFYLLGIKEWLDYPNRAGIEIFKKNNRVHWSKNEKTKNFTKPDYISYMHEFAFEYRRLPEGSRPVTDSAMDTFCSAVFDLTRKYAAWKRK